jgi:hypothetical protein
MTTDRSLTERMEEIEKLRRSRYRYEGSMCTLMVISILLSICIGLGVRLNPTIRGGTSASVSAPGTAR